MKTDSIVSCCNCSEDMSRHSHTKILILLMDFVFFHCCTVAPSVSLAAGQIRTELEAGNNLTLSVNITRFNAPLTSITWNYSGNILTDAINSPSLESPPVVSSLQLTSLTPQDIGYYVVTAVNKFGSDDVTFEVNVLGMFVHVRC